jgi:hypothetical protein
MSTVELYRGYAPRGSSPHRLVFLWPVITTAALLDVVVTVGLAVMLYPLRTGWGVAVLILGALGLAALLATEAVIRRRELAAWRAGEQW